MEISRTEQKRRMKQLEQLVREICALPPGVIAGVPCDEEVRDLMVEVAAMKGGERKRLIKYITKLLKREPVDALYDFLSRRKGAALREKKEFHELEFYRDALLNETLELYREAEEFQEDISEERSGEIVREIAAKFPGIDVRALASLAWLFSRTRNRRYAREIFRMLRAASEQQKIFREQPGDQGV